MPSSWRRNRDDPTTSSRRTAGRRLMSKLAVIDTDAHVTEASDLWTSRISSKWGDLVPHIRMIKRGKTFEEARSLAFGPDLPPIEAWFTGDTMLAPAGASAYAGWKEPFPLHPPTIE